MIFVVTLLAMLFSAINGEGAKALTSRLNRVEFGLWDRASASMVSSKIFADIKGAIPKADEIARQAIETALVSVSDHALYVRENFSQLVEVLQVKAYDIYKEHERSAGAKAMRVEFERKLKPDAKIADILEIFELSFFELDKLFLSFSQSRKARAGSAFQTIIAELLKKLDYPFEAQPVLKDSKPDFVLPSKAWYNFNASDCVILTLKRTLRERWRQVPTEGNTGITFFLATIDAKVPPKELERMKDLNVRLVVPKRLKGNEYKKHPAVISFEDFLEDYLDPAVKRWKRNGAI
jgi:EcoRII C terminal